MHARRKLAQQLNAHRVQSESWTSPSTILALFVTAIAGTSVHRGFEGSLFSPGALPNLVRANARYLGNIQATALKKMTSCRALWAGLWRNMCGETALGFTRLRGCRTVKRPTRPEYCAGKRSVSGADIGTLRPARASDDCNAQCGRLSPEPPKRNHAMTQLTLDHHLGARGSHPQLTPGEQSTTKLVGASL